jgi:hypothetical protein
MTRLLKLLDKLGKFVEKHNGGSSYYTIGDKLIRVSNHFSTSNLGTNCLNIVVPNNSKSHYIVCFNGNPSIFKSFTELKSFLCNFVIFSNFNIIKNSEFDKSIDLLSKNNQIKKLSKDLKDTQEKLKVLNSTKILVGNTFSLSDFSIGQQKQILAFTKQRTKKKK